MEAMERWVLTEVSSTEEKEAELEYDFVEELREDQICSICMKVLCQPQLVNCCEQQFCQECLETWLEDNRSFPHCYSTDY